MISDVEAHEGAVWALAARLDGQGIVSGAADKRVKFWDFTVRSPFSPFHSNLGDAVVFLLTNSVCVLSGRII